MSRVFITGSSDGLGLLAGRLLAAGRPLCHAARPQSGPGRRHPRGAAGGYRAALTEVELPR